MNAPGLTAALVGGVLTLLSPCSVMLLPAFFSYAFTTPTRLLGRTGIFYLGLLVTLVPMGLAAGATGALLVAHRDTLVAVAATVLIVLGMVQVLGIPLPVPHLRRSRARVGVRSGGTGSVGGTPGGGVPGGSAHDAGTHEGGADSARIFLMGAAFGAAGTCSGPVLGSVLTIAALGGSALHGGLALAVYGAGMALPLVMLSWLWSRSDRVRAWVRPRPVTVLGARTTWTQVVGGLLSLGVGMFLLVSRGVTSSGVLSTTQQFAVESWVVDHLGAVPDRVFALAVVALVGGVALVGLPRLRRRRGEAVPRSEPAPDASAPRG